MYICLCFHILFINVGKHKSGSPGGSKNLMSMAASRKKNFRESNFPKSCSKSKRFEYNNRCKTLAAGGGGGDGGATNVVITFCRNKE
jgi:hypothetical protein